MTDLNKVIAGTKAIEKILTEKFGGTGRGMTEKLNSARYPVPEALQKRVKHLAWLRNRSVHEEGFTIPDVDDYAAKCAAVCEELNRAHVIALRAASERSTLQRKTFFSAAPAMVIAAAAWFFLTPGTEPPPLPQAVQQQAQAVPPKLEASKSLPPSSSSVPHNEIGTESKNASAVKTTSIGGEVKEPHVLSNGNIGISTDVLAINDIDFGYVKGSFNNTEPNLSVLVRNTSDKTISSATFHARLYLNGEGAPALDTSSGYHPDRIYMFFGDTGLAPGATSRQRLRVKEYDWTMPDAINAKSRQLVVRVETVEDGRKKKFGDKAAAWPSVTGKAIQPLNPKSRPSAGVAQQELRDAFRAGEHIAIGDSNIELSEVKLSLVKDSFNGTKPNVTFTATNRSGSTISHAHVHMQLFVKGETVPVFDSTTTTFKEPYIVVFGEGGLTDGQTSREKLSLSSSTDFILRAPDISKAIRDGQAQLVLRVDSYADGRRNRHKVSATSLSPL